MKDLLKRTLGIASMVMLLLSSLTTISCSKEDTPVGETSTLDQATRDVLANCDIPRSDSPWSRNLGNGITLRDTGGLMDMALFGRHDLLAKEFCEAVGVKSGSIPSNLGDDPYGQGYAPIRIYGEWLIAMYHPSGPVANGHDHWIMYRPSDGYWERWDLGHRSQSIEEEDGNPYLIDKSN